MEPNDPLKPHRELLQRMHAFVAEQLLLTLLTQEHYKWPSSPYPRSGQSGQPSAGEKGDSLGRVDDDATSHLF